MTNPLIARLTNILERQNRCQYDNCLYARPLVKCLLAVAEAIPTSEHGRTALGNKIRAALAQLEKELA